MLPASSASRVMTGLDLISPLTTQPPAPVASASKATSALLESLSRQLAPQSSTVRMSRQVCASRVPLATIALVVSLSPLALPDTTAQRSPTQPHQWTTSWATFAPSTPTAPRALAWPGAARMVRSSRYLDSLHVTPAI